MIRLQTLALKSMNTLGRGYSWLSLLPGNRKQNGFGDFTVIQGVKVVVRPIVGHERDVGGVSSWQRSVGWEAIDAWFDCGVL